MIQDGFNQPKLRERCEINLALTLSGIGGKRLHGELLGPRKVARSLVAERQGYADVRVAGSELEAAVQELSPLIELAEVHVAVVPGCRGGRCYRDPGQGALPGRCGPRRAGRRRGAARRGLLITMYYCMLLIMYYLYDFNVYESVFQEHRQCMSMS